ncbi:MAG: hypothetical protein HC857_12570 [Synechococcales cyanobacterium RU_4_20]|nr:hypothetical protein [Synechococcales cyanobacterium RU_4_20]NJR69462.1 hypothetical protein [Synechococcales cyanobacterium CRU_2_2]
MLSNAFKFTPEGTVSLQISASRRNGTYYLRATVADTGIGTSPDFQAKILQPFEQVDRHHYQGAGLGLAICQGLTHAHAMGDI